MGPCRPGHVVPVGVQCCTLDFDVDMWLLLFDMVIVYALALCGQH